MSQSILLKKILMRLRVFRVSEWNKTYNKNNDLFYYVRWDGCSFINLILWLRERIYEIGIFLSIGTSKIQIIMQFIFELIFISIPSIISSLFLGNVLLKVIVDGFVNSED